MAKNSAQIDQASHSISRYLAEISTDNSNNLAEGMAWQNLPNRTQCELLHLAKISARRDEWNSYSASEQKQLKSEIFRATRLAEKLEQFRWI